MKTILKRVITLIITVAVITTMTGITCSARSVRGAEAFEKYTVRTAGSRNSITYKVSGGRLYFDIDEESIYWADGDMKELTIPSKIEGHKVKTVGRWALSGLKKLQKINLPSDRNVLSEGSLAEIVSLKEFTIPDGYETIPKSCFYGCKSLKKVSMPASITSIGDMAFYQCDSLEYVDIPGNCMKIGRMAFYECTGLKGIAFAKGTECDMSGWGIFYRCTSLEKIVNVPSTRLNMFYESGKRAEKYLDTPEMIKSQSEMWRLRFPTEEERNSGITMVPEDEVAKREKAVRSKAEEITKGCKTDREKIKAVMLWITKYVDYERGHDNHPWAVFTGILEVESGKKKEQLNSCGGYSNLTQVMLQSLGIPCATIWREARNGESIDHEFNAAYFEGKWRWLDTTHSDNEKGDDSDLELDVRTPGFFFDSDHRADYLLYRSGRNGDTNIYKEIPLDISVKEDKKDWPDQNPADTYEAGKVAQDPDWVHETDPAVIDAEKKKIKQRESEFPSIPVSSESLFTFDSSTGTITAFDGSNETRINIPEKIGGVSVKAIGEKAFAYNRKLEYVYMPDTVTTVGDSAFSGCRALKRVHLSSSLTRMSSYMFSNCDSLDSITIPASVKKMGYDIFSSCDSLEEALFEDYDFKIRVIETDPLGSDNNIDSGVADISWYCFAGGSGRALHGLDFHETYIGTKYYKQLQNVNLTDNWRQNIVNIHQSQMGYREGFSPYHLDGSNSKEFRLSGKAVDYEWGHFAEASRFTGYQPATWCRAFIEWTYAMAGVGKDHNAYLTECKWEDTVYAGGTIKLEPGDMLGMGKSHWCMVGSVKELKDSVEIWILHGNHDDRKVGDEVVHYDKKTGKAIDMEDDHYNYFRALYHMDFSKMQTRTVKLDAGDGKCDVKSRVYCEGAYYGCLPEAKREGYVFDGWYTEREGGLKAYPYRNVGDGVTTLYAHYTYNPNAVTGVSLSRDKVKLGLDKQLTLTANVVPAKAEDKSVTWRSGNDEVVTVKDGVIKGVVEGKATILAQTKEGLYVAYCDVEVVKSGGEGKESDKDSEKISDPGSDAVPDKTLRAGSKITLKVKKKIAKVEVSDASVATVKKKSSKKVIVKGKKAGTVTVKAYNKKGKVIGSWVVKVKSK